jgi:hypothetical protein
LTREGVNAAALVLDAIEGKDPTTGAVVRPPVRLVSVDGLDSERDRESFRWRFVIAAEVARAERERIKARNIATRQRLSQAGRFTGGSIPYGTHVVTRDGRKYLEVEPIEADRLRQAASRLIRGDSMRSVLRFMHTNEWRTRRGFEWQRSSLRVSLLSDAAKEHVFDAATMRALNERLSPRWSSAPKDTGGRPSPSWLRGLLECPCGARMTSHPRTVNGRRVRRYVCQRASQSIPCAFGVSVAAEPAEAIVEAEYLAQFGRLGHVEPRVMLEGAEDLNAAEKAAEDAREALLQSPDAETLASYQAAQQAVEAARGEPLRRQRMLVATGKTIADVWAESNEDDRRGLVSDALAEPIRVLAAREFPASRTGNRGGAVVNPERFIFTWRNDEDFDSE